MKVPYAGRVYDDREKELLREAAEEFTLTAGRFAARFEQMLQKYLGLRHVALCNSGSSANLLAFMALTQPELGDRCIKQSDEVITTAACFPTTVAPLVQYGAVPVFVDIDSSYNIDWMQLEAALSPKTKAVMVAHTMGNPFNIRGVLDFCRWHGLWLIEDNCDALGSEYRMPETRKTGTFGHISTLSFYPAHHITTGEGGAVCTDDQLLAGIVRSLRDWGRDCSCAPGQDDRCGGRFEGQHGSLPEGYDHKYVYSHFGYNLKMTDLQAAIGCAQMEKLGIFTEVRRNNWRFLREMLQDVEGLVLPRAEAGSDPSWFAFVLTVASEAPFTRNEIVRHLEARGIQTRPLFAGNILRQPCFEDGPEHRVIGSLPNTDYVTNNSFLVGVYPGLTREHMTYLGETILAFTGAYAYSH